MCAARAVAPRNIPRLPVLGWNSFKGPRDSDVPSVLDARELVYTQSGRAAIALALRLLAIGHGDKVLVPTYHCPTIIVPIVAAGAEPVFYPLDVSGSPSMEFLEQHSGSGVPAILVALYFGIAQPMLRLRRLCDDAGIALIEYSAHALFGTADGRSVGSWGDFAIASLTKFLPVPEGGCLVSNIRSLSELTLQRRSVIDEVRASVDAVEIGVQHNRFPGLNHPLKALFRVKGALRRKLSSGRGSEPQPSGSMRRNGSPQTLEPAEPARAVRWIARHAARSTIVSRRKQNYVRLAELLYKIPGLRVLHENLPENTVPYVLSVLVDDPDVKYHRLRLRGIPIYRWDEVWWSTPTLPGDVGLTWAREVFQHGCHQDLSLDDLEAMASEIRQVFHI